MNLPVEWFHFLDLVLTESHLGMPSEAPPPNYYWSNFHYQNTHMYNFFRKTKWTEKRFQANLFFLSLSGLPTFSRFFVLRFRIWVGSARVSWWSCPPGCFWTSVINDDECVLSFYKNDIVLFKRMLPFIIISKQFLQQSSAFDRIRFIQKRKLPQTLPRQRMSRPKRFKNFTFNFCGY